MSRAQLRGLSGSLPHHVRINSSICSCIFRPLSTSLAAGIRGHGPAVQSNYPARLSITYALDELASLQGNSGRLLVQRSTSADICISMIYGLNDLALLQIQVQQRSTRRLRLHQTAELECHHSALTPVLPKLELASLRRLSASPGPHTAATWSAAFFSLAASISSVFL